MRTKRKSARARIDSDNPAWGADTFRRARPARELLPKIYGAAIAAKMLRPRGRPKSESPRTLISLRLPPDVLARWKAKGPGWQTRMVKVLSRTR
jgi:uncharacterized protein (DUF4415 family)